MTQVKNEIIIEILESYVEFIEIVRTHDDNFNKIMAKHRKRDWKPVLDDVLKKLKKEKK
jgi:hypothetical protein